MEHTRILVPLDGSPAAERALEEALTLAKALQAGVVLLQVVPPIEDVLRERAMTLAIDEVWEMQRHSALQYLNNVRTRPEWKDVVTEATVELGDPAETILEVCEKRGIDRIVMATHGRTGVKRWVFGSVAEKVLRAADRTVVLVRAGQPESQRPLR